MTRMRWKLVGGVVLFTVSLTGCDKKDSGGAGGGASTSATGGSTAAITAKAAEVSGLPAKGPWEAIKITALDKKDPSDGSPYFKVDNLGGKAVEVIFMDFYGYDAKNKQLAHTERSWNGELKGGASTETYTQPNKDVVTWEATYHGIRFAGESLVTDYKRTPATRPKGGA